MLALLELMNERAMQRLQLKALLIWPTFRCSFRANIHSQSVKLNSSLSLSSSLEYTPWSGLKAWRQSPINENRFWGSNGPEALVESSSNGFLFDSRIESASSLAELGALVLSTSDPLIKSRLSHLAYSRWSLEDLPIGVFEAPRRPARPPQPKLVRSLYFSKFFILVKCSSLFLKESIVLFVWTCSGLWICSWFDETLTHVLHKSRSLQGKFRLPKARGCLWMLICCTILLMLSLMQLIWHGTRLFDFRASVKFLVRGFLLILLMLLMMRAVILHGVHRDLLNLDSSEEIINLGCSSWYLFVITYLDYIVTRYGDMAAHNLLWRECEKSSDNVAARLAAIPLVQVNICPCLVLCFFIQCLKSLNFWVFYFWLSSLEV